jgi:hypothetical protein
MGDSSCECPHKSYIKDTSEATVRVALGPAYEDVRERIAWKWHEDDRLMRVSGCTRTRLGWQYKHGNVHIHTTWEQDRSLVPYYLPECCTKLE